MVVTKKVGSKTIIAPDEETLKEALSSLTDEELEQSYNGEKIIVGKLWNKHIIYLDEVTIKEEFPGVIEKDLGEVTEEDIEKLLEVAFSGLTEKDFEVSPVTISSIWIIKCGNQRCRVTIYKVIDDSFYTDNTFCYVADIEEKPPSVDDKEFFSPHSKVRGKPIKRIPLGRRKAGERIPILSLFEDKKTYNIIMREIEEISKIKRNGEITLDKFIKIEQKGGNIKEEIKPFEEYCKRVNDK